MSDRKAVIKNADMSEDMQQDAVDCACQALEKYNIEKASFLLMICFWADTRRARFAPWPWPYSNGASASRLLLTHALEFFLL